MKLSSEALNSIIDEVGGLRKTINEPVQVADTAKNHNKSLELSDETYNLKDPEEHRPHDVMQKTPYSSLNYLSTEMINHTLFFLSEAILRKIIDTKNIQIQKVVFKHLEPYNHYASFDLNMDFHHGNNSLNYFKVRSNHHR